MVVFAVSIILERLAMVRQSITSMASRLMNYAKKRGNCISKWRLSNFVSGLLLSVMFHHIHECFDFCNGCQWFVVLNICGKGC